MGWLDSVASAVAQAAVSDAAQGALRELAARTGARDEISTDDVRDLFKQIDSDGDAETLSRPELEKYLHDRGIPKHERELLLARAFIAENAGNDGKLTPQEAIAATMRKTGDKVFGIKLRR